MLQQVPLPTKRDFKIEVEFRLCSFFSQEILQDHFFPDFSPSRTNCQSKIFFPRSFLFESTLVRIGFRENCGPTGRSGINIRSFLRELLKCDFYSDFYICDRFLQVHFRYLGIAWALLEVVVVRLIAFFFTHKSDAVSFNVNY